MADEAKTEEAEEPLALERNEYAFIGALLVNPGMVRELAVKMGVTEASFRCQRMLAIWKAVCAIEGRGERAETYSVCLELGGRDPEQQEYWLNLISNAINDCVTPAYSAHYIRTMRQVQGTREMKAVLEDSIGVLETNPKRIWEVCKIIATVLRAMNAIKVQVGA